MKPQFHGREHLNLHIFRDLLRNKNQNLLTSLKHRSYIALPEHKNYRQGWTSAYAFRKIEETSGMLDNIKDGLKYFNQVYGYEAKVFTPSAASFPPNIEAGLPETGSGISTGPDIQTGIREMESTRKSITNWEKFIRYPLSFGMLFLNLPLLTTPMTG